MLQSYPDHPELYQHDVNKKYNIRMDHCLLENVKPITPLLWMIMNYESSTIVGQDFIFKDINDKDNNSRKYPLLLNDIFHHIDNNDIFAPVNNLSRADNILKVYNMCSMDIAKKIVQLFTQHNNFILYIILENGNEYTYSYKKAKLFISYIVSANYKYRMASGLILTYLSGIINNTDYDNDSQVKIVKLLLDKGADPFFKYEGTYNDIEYKNDYIYAHIDKNSQLYNLFANYRTPISLQGLCLLTTISDNINTACIPDSIICNLHTDKRFTMIYNKMLKCIQEFNIIKDNMNTLRKGFIIVQ